MESENISLIIIRFMSTLPGLRRSETHGRRSINGCWYLHDIRLDPYRVKLVSISTWSVGDSSGVTLCSG
jgi:hypothetical protein